MKAERSTTSVDSSDAQLSLTFQGTLEIDMQNGNLNGQTGLLRQHISFLVPPKVLALGGPEQV